MNTHKLTAGYSKTLDRYYELSITDNVDGGIKLSELYEYSARGSIEGREYQYKVIVPATSRERFIEHLVGKCEKKNELVVEGRNVKQVLMQLIEEQQLATYENVGLKQNYNTLVRWLKEAGIEYEDDVFVWVSFDD